MARVVWCGRWLSGAARGEMDGARLGVNRLQFATRRRLKRNCGAALPAGCQMKISSCEVAGRWQFVQSDTDGQATSQEEIAI